MEHYADHALFPRKLRMEFLETLCGEEQSYSLSLSEGKSHVRIMTQLKNCMRHLKTGT